MSVRSPCLVVVTHSSALFRDGLQRILSGTPFRSVIAATAILTDDMLETLSAAAVAIWVMGVDEFGSAAESQWRHAKSCVPKLKAVVLARERSIDQLARALQAEVSGYLDQDIDSERLVRALHVVALGDTVLHGQSALGQYIAAGKRECGGPLEWGRAESYGRTAKPQDIQGSPAGTCCALADAKATSAGVLTSPDASAIASLPHSDFDPDGLEDGEATDEGLEQPQALALRCLSKRERAILRLLIEGLSNKVIAHRLVITEATVKVHIKGCLRKLRLHNRTQAAMWASKYLVAEEPAQAPTPVKVSAHAH